MQSDKDQLLAKIVKNIESYVEYLKDNNVTEIVSSRLCRGKAAEQVVTRFPPAPEGFISAEQQTTTSHEKTGEPAETMMPEEALKAIAAAVAACKKCPLHQKRNKTVPGQGNNRPEILFIGEGPGEDEDRQGLAFVGRAGQLLTRLIVRMGFTREEVFIANIVKCRPPNNRKPLPEEMNACRPYLEEQIVVLKPKVMVLLGASAFEGIMQPKSPGMTISRVRGKWLEYRGVAVMPTFHPSYLLRNQSAMWDVWNDMQLVLERLGRTAPARDKQTSN